MSAAKWSLVFNGLFVGLLFAVHLLKPDLDPSWHFISEYAIGRHGWVMQAAFLALAASNIAALIAIRDSLRNLSGKVGAGLFLVGTVGLLLAAAFVTDPMNTPPEARTTSGNLHNLGGGLGLLGFVGTLVFSARLLRSDAWRTSRPAVWSATAILVLGFLVSFISITAIAAKSQGVFGPDTPIGWPNRIGILSGCAWLAIVAWRAKRIQLAPGGDSQAPTVAVLLFCLSVGWSHMAPPSLSAADELEADLLIVGGGESGCAAAVQATRLGVRRVVLVNDIDWLGGQFSAEGVGCLDEWTTVNGKRTNFPRSGLFLEIVNLIRAHNSAKYGVPCPGNAYCGTETIEPAAAAALFEQLVRPHVDSGSLRIQRRWIPRKVLVDAPNDTDQRFPRVAGVEFQHADDASRRLTVKARITIDASDWGDVIRLSGARYGAGPDLKSRFDEPSAPESLDEAGRQEMNPISWCLVLRETPARSDPAKSDPVKSDPAKTGSANSSGARIDSTIPRPATYHAASFAALDKTPPWVDSDMSGGIYSQSGWSIYTHRRLVDRWHFGFAPGTEATFLNWPVQDYPLCQLPQRVVDALERLRPGASRLNIVDLEPRERQVIFDDARQHALGLLHHLQTAIHDRVGDFPQSFRYLQLTDEFGTPDRLPPKPYVREGLRLEALTMLREQDIRAATREPKWAKTLPSDSVFGFQFNIDFHPTRRKYLTEDRNGPWQFVHTPSRNWHTDTDRAVFPLRGLVPVATDGLLGGGKNIGVSSIVQSALRLHGQMMHVGQASGTIAALCLREQLQPRDVAAETRRWREVQRTLVRGRGGPGVLLWPWHDVAPTDSHFEAANMLAVRNIWPADPDSVFFHGDRPLTRRELARTLDRLLRHLSDAPAKLKSDESSPTPRFTDVPADDVDRAAIESLIARGKFGPQRETFQPDAVVDWGSLHRWLVALDLPASPGLVEKDRAELPLTRAEAARHLWRAVDLIGPP